MRKIKNIITTLFVSLIILTISCNNDVETPQASFKAFVTDDNGSTTQEAEANGVININVGTTVNFKLEGISDKAVIWTGDSIIGGISHDYDLFLESGKDPVNYSGVSLIATTEKYDYQHQYGLPGSYTVYVIVTNVGNKGQTVEQAVATLTVNVADPDNEFSVFQSFGLINLGSVYVGYEYTGVVSENTITVDVPGGAGLTRVITNFQVGKGTKVFVGNELQVSGLTQNDFTNPVIYKLVSITGIETEYTVSVNRMPPETGTEIISYSLPELGINGDINNTDHTISLLFNYGTDMNVAYKAEFTKSLYATLKVGSKPQRSGVTANLYNENFVYSVYAEDRDIVTDYQVLVDTTPGIVSATMPNLVPVVSGDLNYSYMTLNFSVLEGTDVSKAIISINTYPLSATIRVVSENGQVVDKEFESGVTPIDLTQPAEIVIEDTELNIKSKYTLSATFANKK